MAEETGIDANALINNNYHAGFYKNNELQLINKKYKGKSYLRIWKIPLKNGLNYPILYFGTHKHGGVIHKFNGYRWLWESFEGNIHIIKPSSYHFHKKNGEGITSQTYYPKNNTTPNEINKNFVKLFTLFPSFALLKSKNAYLTKKCPWLTPDTLKRVCLKEGHDNWGNFIIAPMQDFNKNVMGFQRIYENKIIKRNSNKDFCVKYAGAKKGAFIYISGNETLGYVCVCEGLTTALSFADLEPAPIYVALDAGNLHLVCNSLTQPIRLYCDNDYWSNTNTGLEAGLKIKEKRNKTNLLIPPTELYSKANDYNDLRNIISEKKFTQLIICLQKDSHF